MASELLVCTYQFFMTFSFLQLVSYEYKQCQEECDEYLISDQYNCCLCYASCLPNASCCLSNASCMCSFQSSPQQPFPTECLHNVLLVPLWFTCRQDKGVHVTIISHILGVLSFDNTFLFPFRKRCSIASSPTLNQYFSLQSYTS